MSKENKVSDNDGDIFPITELPDEIVLKILRFLFAEDVLFAVCWASRRLRCLGLDSITELDVGHTFVGTKWPARASAGNIWLLKKLIDRCPGIRIVRLDRYGWPSNKSIELAIHVLKNCPRLEALCHLSNADPTFYDALQIHGHSLKRLSLIHGGILEPDKMRHLTHIKISYYSLPPGGSSEEFLRHILDIGECSKSLESFTLQCYDNRLDRREEIKIFLQSIRGTIKKLCLDERLMVDTSYSVLPTSQRLEKLELNHATNLSLFRLRSILRLPNLVELCIKGSNTMISEEDYVRAFSEGCWQALKRLNLCVGYFLGDAALLAIAQGCPELITLTIDFSKMYDAKFLYSKTVTDDGFRRSVLVHCRKLRELALDGTWNLTSNAFADIKESLPLLRSLWVQDLALFIHHCFP